MSEGTMIDEDLARLITDAGVRSVNIRTSVTRKAPKGSVRSVSGLNMAENQIVQNPVKPVGLVAAQSIGEPGTQLTLRTFHTGGTPNSRERGATGHCQQRRIYPLL